MLTYLFDYSYPENQRVIIMELEVSPKMSQCQVMKI